MSTYQRMGEFLLAKGLITRPQLDGAIEARSRSNLRFGEILVVLGYVDEAEVTRCLSEQYQLPIANLSKLQPTPEALKIVSSLFAITRLFLPVAITDETVYAVICDPIDLELTDKIVRETGRRLALALSTSRELKEAVSRFYELPNSMVVTVPEPARSARKSKKPRHDDQTDRRELLETLASFAEPVDPAA